MIRPAEVVEVNYLDDNNTGLYTVSVRLLDDKNMWTRDNIGARARPINASLRIPPVKGEVVLVIKAPSNLSSKSDIRVEYYYLQPLNIQSSPNHNALPTIGKGTGRGRKGGDYQSSQGASNQSSDSEEKELGDFPENTEIRPLQPYEGDVLLEGRHGQSIRMGSTITEGTDKYTLAEPQWEDGDGAHGDPITVIRNGQKDDDGFSSKPDANKFILENIDYDKSSIYLTSTQRVAITKASPDNVAYTQLEMTDSTDDYTGAQCIIAGDRLIFNAREKEIFMFAGGGIALSSHFGVTIDSSGGGVNIAGSIINLGNDAENNGEPAVLGENLRECLAGMCDIIDSALNTLTSHVHGYPGTTPSPDGAPAWGTDISDLAALRQTHGIDSSNSAEFHSEYIFVNKETDYDSEGEPDERKTN